jgi:hypothetical protein
MTPKTYIPFVNRPDLLWNAIKSLGIHAGSVVVVDNSPQQDAEKQLYGQGVLSETCQKRGDLYWVTTKDAGVEFAILKPSVPLFTAQTFNLVNSLGARDGWCMFMHNDAEASEEVWEAVAAKAEELFVDGSKTAAVFTIFDAFCAFNCKCYNSIGGYDATFQTYFVDDDVMLRMRRAGFEFVSDFMRDKVKHFGSATIRSDEYLKRENDAMHELRHQYYQKKWGGEPGNEAFSTPFQS